MISTPKIQLIIVTVIVIGQVDIFFCPFAFY